MYESRFEVGCRGSRSKKEPCWKKELSGPSPSIEISCECKEFNLCNTEMITSDFLRDSILRETRTPQSIGTILINRTLLIVICCGGLGLLVSMVLVVVFKKRKNRRASTKTQESQGRGTVTNA
ncbi:hypothetical protein QR680_011064 [Steinernema hermaphroditum]|uniref:Uncharacterized protein n=1 Tax=Steinernema hermaphroditum TaxID=289476 RepID=A0AA39IQZ5_9BILA|nr:hypothetical protein QR680_011064 [Steinernema hermaphroditum]